MSDHDHKQSYYIPHSSSLPIVNAIGMFFLGLGSIEIMEVLRTGLILIGIGTIILLINMFTWFATTIRENRHGLHDAQMERTYRWGIFWYLFAQGSLAFAFLGAMFYVRTFTLPWMAGVWGEPAYHLTHLLLWPNFEFSWPLLVNPAPAEFIGPHVAPNPWAWPLIGTILMLVSVISLIWARSAFKKEHRSQTVIGLAITWLLSLFFTVTHIYTVIHAIITYNLTTMSGIYGSLFFMINVVLCLNLLVGVIFLFVVMCRTALGHFNLKNQFSLHAVSKIWYFTAILWLIIFFYVYVFSFRHYALMSGKIPSFPRRRIGVNLRNYLRSLSRDLALMSEKTPSFPRRRESSIK